MNRLWVTLAPAASVPLAWAHKGPAHAFEGIPLWQFLVVAAAAVGVPAIARLVRRRRRSRSRSTRL